MRREPGSLAVQISNQLEQVLIVGDLKDLTSDQRIEYYRAFCKSLRFNVLTRPVDYILFKDYDGPERLELYVNAKGAAQLRKMHRIGIVPGSLRRQFHEDHCITTVEVIDGWGKTDAGTGSVTMWKYKNGEQTALVGREWDNAVMKSETKAKRRATLSVCGLANLDESQLESMQVLGGVTEDGRIYRYTQPELEDLPATGSREAAQAVAARIIAEAKAGKPSEPAKASPEPPAPQEPPSQARGTIELDWSEDEKSPILRGDIGDLLEMIKKHTHAAWGADSWWHVEPRDAETLREMCKQLNYRLTEIMPKSSGAVGKEQRAQHHQTTQRQPPAPGTKRPAGGTQAAEPTAIAAVIQHFTEKMTAGRGKRPAQPYLNVLLKTDHGDRWYSCFDRQLFEYLSKGKGKNGEFVVAQSGDYWNLTGIVRIGNVEFHENKPVIRTDREPGSRGLF